jgi:hypothetical protein
MLPKTRVVQKVGRLLRIVAWRLAASYFIILPLGRRRQMCLDEVAYRNQG